jgi:two-component system CheB/CheR fusion protein
VTVRDTGVGIDAKLLPRVFTAFTQADRTLERSKGGLGLGLALVKGLVELHQGDVSAHSEGVGTGTTVTFRLPLAAAPLAGDTPRQEPAKPARLLVLVVEDNVDAAETVQILLELDGHEVAVAHTGTDGIEMARRLRPDLVLCDLGLPGTSGFEVARALRQDAALSGVRLVAVSGYGRESDQRQARESGFERVLVKPVSPEALRQLLAELR